MGVIFNCLAVSSSCFLLNDLLIFKWRSHYHIGYASISGGKSLADATAETTFIPPWASNH